MYKQEENGKMEEKVLKNRIREELDKYEKIRKIIFTTYDFDTEFFENQLLPYLFHNHNNLEYEKGEFKTAYELEEKWKKISQENKTLIDVYYDHLVGDKQKYVHYNAYKVTLERGIFHPKLIIIIGKKKPWNKRYFISVIVLSGNITTKSYGENLEVIGILEKRRADVNIEELKNPNISNVLNMIKTIFGNNLLISGELTKNETVLDKLKRAKKIKIITPFLSEDVLEGVLENKNVQVIFTNIMGMNPKTKKYIKEKLDNDNYSFYVMKNKDDETKRKIHAKIYILDRKEAIIGSHNFTKAAISGNNVEASIVVKDEKIAGKLLSYYDGLKRDYKDKINEDILDDETIISSINDEKEQGKGKINITNAEIDWNESKIRVYLNQDKTNSVDTIKINMIGVNTLKKEIYLHKEKENFEYDFKENLEITNLLHSNKYFEGIVKEKNNEEKTIEGIFNEVGNIDDLIENDKAMINDDYMDLLEYDINKRENLKLKQIFYESEDERDKYLEEDLQEEKENQEDLARMFLAYKNINKSIDDIINENKDKKIKKVELEKRYFTDANSILRIIKLFLDYIETDNNDNLKNKEDKDRKLLYYLLTCNELTLLLDRYENEFQEKYELQKLDCGIEKILNLKDKKTDLKNKTIEIMYDENKNESKEKIEEKLEIYLKQFGEIKNG